MCCSCTEALSQTGRLIGTEWREFWLGACMLESRFKREEEEEEEEERIEGREKRGCLGFNLTSQLLILQLLQQLSR